MGRLFLEYVEAPCVYVCLSCRTHLSAHDSIISKAFQGRHGRAYLFGDVVNINSGPTENRLLLTGLHVVADIYCNACDERLGWKYVEAFEESQKYKEGRFILEKAKIIKEVPRHARGSKRPPADRSPPIGPSHSRRRLSTQPLATAFGHSRRCLSSQPLVTAVAASRRRVGHGPPRRRSRSPRAVDDASAGR